MRVDSILNETQKIEFSLPKVHLIPEVYDNNSHNSNNDDIFGSLSTHVYQKIMKGLTA